MRGKKGVIFSFYLVLITAFLCFSSIMIFYNNQRKVDNSIISPRTVFEVEDNLSVFEMKERQYLFDFSNNYLKIKNNFSSKDVNEDFLHDLKKKFIEDINEDSSAKNFLLGNLYVDGKKLERKSILNEKDFLKNYVYKFSLNGFVVHVQRRPLEKRFVLKPAENNKINFPIEFSYKFSRGYFVYFDDKGKKFKVDSSRGLEV